MTMTDKPALGRRSFLRGAAFAAVAAPILTEAQLAVAAQTAATPSGMALHGQSPNAPPPSMTLINANDGIVRGCQDVVIQQKRSVGYVFASCGTFLDTNTNAMEQ